MRCPFCGHIEQKVLDSRPGRDGDAIRRRRECLGCGRRFTTFEAPERPRLWLAKRDGTREEFQRDKCLASMVIACRKRQVPVDRLEDAVDRIERDLVQEFEDEAPTRAVGELVMRELRLIDTVAYVRFASVYREFQSLEDFREIVETASIAAFDWRQPALEV